jgi:hypothetical protein
MPEPTAAAGLTLAGQAVAIPALTLFGMSLGLRADILLAGFGGAVAAMALLNTVPSTGDTWRELLRTSARRVGVSVGSAVTAGYTAPLLSLINGVPETLTLSLAFVAGAGAMQVLPWLIERFGKGRGATPPQGDQ